MAHHPFQLIEKLVAEAFVLKFGMNRQIADDRAIDFIPKSAACADEPSRLDRKQPVTTVLEGQGNRLRRPLTETSSLI